MDRRPITLLVAVALAAVAGGLLLRRAAGRADPDAATARPAAPAAAATVNPEMLARLEALGYSEKAIDDPDPSRRGVTLSTGEAEPGINFFCTGSTVRFVAMDGTVVGEVALDVGASPGAGCLAALYGDTAVAVVASPLLSLTRLSSQPRWTALGPYHHDIASGRDGLLYTLGRRDSFLARNGRTYPIQGQAIVALDAKGRLRGSVDLQRIFARFVPDDRLASIERLAPKAGTRDNEEYAVATDVFHPNTLELVSWPHGEHGGAPGRQALLSFRELDRIAVVDLDREELLWEWGAGEMIGQHDPWLLENGNVLVFDNGARVTAPLSRWRFSSRVLEVDPRTGRIVWEYRSDPPGAFFSPSRGGAQPLPGGNVLITESTKGRVFEVTRDGRTVWEFWNTEFDAEGARKSIYRMHRIGAEQFRALRGLRPPR